MVRACRHADAVERAATYRQIMDGAAATFGRVVVALLIGALWTIPVGVADRLQSEAGAHRAAAGADRGVGSGDRAVSDRAAWC